MERAIVSTVMTLDYQDHPARATLERWFREHYAGLVRFAMRYVGQAGEAEEIVQDVFLALWRRRNELPAEGATRGYLYKAVHNRALNAVRHSRITRTAAERDRMERADAEEGVPADESAGLSETERLVGEAIARLPDRCRQVFLLSRESGLSYAEIARSLGISIKTVETQMGRALRALRTELAPLVR